MNEVLCIPKGNEMYLRFNIEIMFLNHKNDYNKRSHPNRIMKCLLTK